MDIDVQTDQDGNIINVIYYSYHPSKVAGFLFVALFGLSTIAHFVLMFPRRSAFFIPLIVGGLMETFGYYGRAWAGDEPDSIEPWILQTLLILAAPPMISATVYMVLGRMINSLDAKENALARPKLVIPLFVLSDLIAFFSQIAGAGLQASTSRSAQETGQKVVLAGLIFQVILFVFFIANIIVFHKRNNRNPTSMSVHPDVPSWRWRIYTLYIGSFCILVRNFVRIIEFAQGAHGSIASHEVYIYVFDATLMWVAMTVFLVVHPGKLIKQAGKIQKGYEKKHCWSAVEDEEQPLALPGEEEDQA